MGDGREHLERPDWYDEAGAWRAQAADLMRMVDWRGQEVRLRNVLAAAITETADPKPEMHATVRNVANDGP